MISEVAPIERTHRVGEGGGRERYRRGRFFLNAVRYCTYIGHNVWLFRAARRKHLLVEFCYFSTRVGRYWFPRLKIWDKFSQMPLLGVCMRARTLVLFPGWAQVKAPALIFLANFRQGEIDPAKTAVAPEISASLFGFFELHDGWEPDGRSFLWIT